MYSVYILILLTKKDDLTRLSQVDHRYSFSTWPITDEYKTYFSLLKPKETCQKKAKEKSSEPIRTAKRIILIPKWVWATDYRNTKRAQTNLVKSYHELLITKKAKNLNISHKEN